MKKIRMSQNLYKGVFLYLFVPWNILNILTV